MQSAGKIFISEATAKQLELPEQAYIDVRAGQIIVKAELLIRSDLKSSFALSAGLTKAMYLRRQKQMKLRYDRTAGHLHLGPTVGILSTFLPNKEEFEPTGVQADIIFLSNMGKMLPGQVYIFTPSSINWANKTARGYVYRQISADRGTWVSDVYPLPDVVYDRVSSRVSEGRDSIKLTKTRLMNQPYLKYFNPHFLNKWKVHQILMNNPRLYQYLPETRLLNAENLQQMLNKYPVLFVKPGNGSLGYGIIKIKANERGEISYVVNRGRGRLRSQAENAEDFLKKTRKIRKDKQYIVQQGLDLATYRGSPFDIRIIYQKDGQGEWQISKKFVRVAAPGSSVSNLSSGGRAEPSKKVLKYLYPKKETIEERNKEIKNLCHTIAITLEKSSNGIFGELGLDIGIDKKGRPYLIEVNSKPRKTTETEYSRVVIRNTFQRPLEYSVYLAGF